MDKPNTVCLPFYYDFIVEDNVIYFPMANYNAMCRGNLLNDQVDIIEIFPDLTADRRLAYSGMYKYKDDLVFFPYKSDSHDIIIYNISQKKLSRLPCDENIFVCSCTIFEKNDYIYAVSSMTDTVYKIDLRQRSIEYIKSPYLADNALITEVVRIDDFLFIPLNQKKVMLVFDLEKEEFKYYEYPESILFISTLCYRCGKLWITGEDRNIYAWDMNEKTICKCAEFPDNVYKYYSGRDWYSLSFVYQDALWLFPAYANVILKYNIMSGSFEELEILEEKENEDDLETGRFFKVKYGTLKRIDKKVFFVSSKTRVLYELDLETNHLRKHYLRVNNIYNGSAYPTPMGGKMIEENYMNGLEVLLYYNENEDGKSKTKKDIIGEKIYDYINDEIAR